MLVPLVAVPLLAIFGVPQFAPLAASSSRPGDEIEQDRDSGLGENARFAKGDELKLAKEKTSKDRQSHEPAVPRNPHAMSSASSPRDSHDNHSANDATRRFIPRDEITDKNTAGNDPFAEFDRATANQLRDRRRVSEPNDPPTNSNSAPREFPGWELDQSFSQVEQSAAEPTRKDADHQPVQDPENEVHNRQDFADAKESQIDIRANNSNDDFNSDGIDRSARTKGQALTRNSSADDTARLFDDQAPAESKKTRNAKSSESSTDNPFADAAGSSSKNGEVVASLGKRADQQQNPSNALSRAKRGVEVATERIERRGPLTWKTAVQRLNGLGIRQYNLEPGQTEGEFLFSCAYAHPDMQRVTRRFEAEAPEPLRAVEKVLTQIEDWMAENETR